MAQTFENLEKYQGCSQEMIEQAVHQATAIVKGNLKDFTDFFQSPNTENGFYWQTENVEWTTGFWTGVVWLAYELTKDTEFKERRLLFWQPTTCSPDTEKTESLFRHGEM